ncbi:MAG: Rpn family recombination-promoting nuclease/putative transposase, partial [Succinivibrio dextrinosolvens]|nr:Rpn family recombination-promoting nuclease/putative transposase [Succinivibrio dextrinosolvens]
MYISLKQQIETDIANKKYNHLNDQLFKFVFGKEERKGITIAFLNAALEREGENEIKDITFANTEFSPLAEHEKSGRLDVYCVTNNGEKVDVEVQINNKGNIEKRTLFYWANMYLIGFTHGHNYKELKPAITINLLNYTNFSKAPVHSVYSVYNKDTNEKLNNDLELHFFEINKFQKKPIEEMTRIERWLAYFSNKLNAKELEELGLKEPMIQNAMNASDTFMNDISERLAYLNREMALSDEVTNRESAIEKGIEIGHEKGLAE